jgi:hypothetical protein
MGARPQRRRDLLFEIGDDPPARIVDDSDDRFADTDIVPRS